MTLLAKNAIWMGHFYIIKRGIRDPVKRTYSQSSSKRPPGKLEKVVLTIKSWLLMRMSDRMVQQ